MPGFPRRAKLKKLIAAFGPAQRRQFWQATGIDISKQSVNKEKFGAFKGSLAEYRRFLAKSSNQVDHETTGMLWNCACDACGRTDENEIYVTVPKCGEFCISCIE